MCMYMRVYVRVCVCVCARAPAHRAILHRANRAATVLLLHASHSIAWHGMWRVMWGHAACDMEICGVGACGV